MTQAHQHELMPAIAAGLREDLETAISKAEPDHRAAAIFLRELAELAAEIEEHYGPVKFTFSRVGVDTDMITMSPGEAVLETAGMVDDPVPTCMITPSRPGQADRDHATFSYRTVIQFQCTEYPLLSIFPQIKLVNSTSGTLSLETDSSISGYAATRCLEPAGIVVGSATRLNDHLSWDRNGGAAVDTKFDPADAIPQYNGRAAEYRESASVGDVEFFSLVESLYLLFGGRDDYTFLLRTSNGDYANLGELLVSILDGELVASELPQTQFASSTGTISLTVAGQELIPNGAIVNIGPAYVFLRIHDELERRQDTFINGGLVRDLQLLGGLALYIRDKSIGLEVS